MSIFSKILNKLGIGQQASAQASEHVPPAASTAVSEQQAPTTQQQIGPTAVSAVDVAAQLEVMAAANQQKLNWKTSIVDLLKLLGLDSSLSARKELAAELNCPAEKMEDSAQMNIWLHKAVLKKLAENGGNVPPELLD